MRRSKECGCSGGSGGYGGSGGDVAQTNLAGAFSAALNANATDQSVEQSQGGGDAAKCGCGHGGDGVQAVGQFAWNAQAADAKAHATQLWPANENTPVRIASPGGSGSVFQTNAALALSLAANLNLTRQEVTQTQ